jgi:hypothetical protein
MSQTSNVANIFKALVERLPYEGDHLDDDVLIGEAILKMETVQERLLIDDAPGIVGNHSAASAKAILHLDFLYEDMRAYPKLDSDTLSAFIDHQYGTLRTSLIAALKPNGVIDLDAVDCFTKRGYLTSPNIKTGAVTVRVRESNIKL